MMVRAFANGPGDLGSYQRLKKMVLDASLPDTQRHKVGTKGAIQGKK